MLVAFPASWNLPRSGVRVRSGCWCQLCGEFQPHVTGEAEIQDVSQSELKEKTEGQGPDTRERLSEHLSKGPGQDRAWDHKVRSSKLGLYGTKSEASEEQARGGSRRFWKITQVPGRAPCKGWLGRTGLTFPFANEDRLTEWLNGLSNIND